MIKTELVSPQTYVNILKKSGEIEKERGVEVDVKDGIFGRTHKEKRTEKYKVKTYEIDEDFISKFPQDIQTKIKRTLFDKRGYPETNFSWNIPTMYFPTKEFTRDFAKTLTEFYEKNKIEQERFISLEYCRDSKDPCKITGAYVTWEVFS